MTVHPSLTADLYPHQRDGVAWLAGRRRGLLAWDMGTGKTPTVIRAADAVEAINVLHLAPAVAKPSMVREWLQWQAVPRSVEAAYGDTVPDTEVVVANYELVHRPKVKKALAGRKWNIILPDEGHLLKTKDTKRTRAIYGMGATGRFGLINHAERVWTMTGTPMPNHAGELYTHLRALYPAAITHADGDLMSDMEFIQRFCKIEGSDYGQGWRITGSKNLDTLRGLLLPFMSRVRKEDVLKDLPPLRVETLVVDPTDAKRELRQVEASDEGRLLRSLVEGRDELSDDDFGLLLDIEAHIARLRRVTGMAKAGAAINLVDAELQGGHHKTILFAHHRDVLQRLYDGLANRWGAVMIHGGTTDKADDLAIQRFQTDPACRVFIGQLDKCNAAITLTAASDVLLVEPSFVPAVNNQAIARAHRIGATHEGILARFLALAGSIDEPTMRLLARKSRAIGIVIDGL